MQEEERAFTHLSTLGFVFQFHFLLPEFFARDNVILPMRALGALSAAAYRSSAAHGSPPGLGKTSFYRSTFGHRANANTHRPSTLSSGTNARIVHQRLRPARCKTFATGR
jgi:ABC-type lipoprotein export system ATPase subunit